MPFVLNRTYRLVLLGGISSHPCTGRGVCRFKQAAMFLLCLNALCRRTLLEG